MKLPIGIAQSCEVARDTLHALIGTEHCRTLSTTRVLLTISPYRPVGVPFSEGGQMYVGNPRMFGHLRRPMLAGYDLTTFIYDLNADGGPELMRAGDLRDPLVGEEPDGRSSRQRRRLRLRSSAQPPRVSRRAFEVVLSSGQGTVRHELRSDLERCLLPASLKGVHMYLTNKVAILSALIATGMFCIPQGMFAQDRDYRHGDYDQVRRLDPGTQIRVRANQPIDSREGGRVYRGFVTDDVRGDNGRVVVPAGSPVNLVVRVMPDNDLRLDLQSLEIRGQHFDVATDPQHVEARQEGGLVGGIIGALSNGQVGGRQVYIPQDAVMTFRLERPLVTGPRDWDRDRDRERDRYYQERNYNRDRYQQNQ
jgi:hypothetical protein